MSVTVRLSAFYFVYFALLGVLAPYLGLYLSARDFDAAEIAQLVALMMATKVIAPNVWGALADRFQVHLLLVRLGAGMTLFGYVLFLLADGFWRFALAIVFFTFFWNAILAQFEVITLFSLGERRDRYSRIRLWGSVGFIVSVGGFGFLLERFGIAWFPWLTLAIIATIMLASAAALPQPRLPPEDVRAGAQFWRICADPRVWMFFVVCFLLQLSHGPYYTYFSLFLASLGYGESMIGALWSLGVLAEVILFVYMHRWFEYSNLRSIMLIALSLTALRWLLIALAAETLPVLLVAQCLHALSFGAMHAASIRYVHRSFAPRYHGRAQALYSSVGFGAGGACGALLSGAIHSGTGSYAWSFGVGFVVALLCIAFTLRIPALQKY
jgi:PPP family 3-phenylpropionic acid transporter